MAKIYIHIGLPKTATTTLQQGVFPKIAHDRLCYVGVKQPRATAQDPLYEAIYQAISRGNAIAATRRAIGEQLAAGTSLIFSEEMVLVSRPQADWRKKLANLAALVEGLDHQLILTVREPVRGLVSYYAEILPSLIKEAGKLSDDIGLLARAQSDPALQIFHYQRLLQELSGKFAAHCIFIKKFEEIVAGELDDLLQLFELPAGTAPPQLPIANQRIEDSTFIHTGQTVTLGDLLRGRCPRPADTNSRSRRFFLRLCRSIAKRLEIPLRQIKVEKPDRQQLSQLRTILQPDIEYLALAYAVDYRTEHPL